MDPNTACTGFPDYSSVLTWLIPLASTLIGAFIAYKATICGVRLAHEKDLQRQKQVEKTALQNFYQAIHSEIETTWEGYLSGIGRNIEALKDDEPLLQYFSGTGEYFPIFKCNTNLIGQVPDRTLRNLVVITYTKLQGLVDALVLNNKYLEDYQQLCRNPYHSSHEAENKTIWKQKITLITFAKQLKAMHNGLKPDIINLIQILKEKTDQQETP